MESSKNKNNGHFFFFFFDEETGEEKKYITGNRGEWSEIYTLFKLLGDGKVHAGDANLNKLPLYYPILNIIREEAKNYMYCPDTEKEVVVIHEDGEQIASIPMSRFIIESQKLLADMKNVKGAKGAFPLPETEAFMREVYCTKLKAPSKNKADIQIIIHDMRTNMKPLLGFSIKSQLGSPSTLLNAGEPTNIRFKITGPMNEQEMVEFNAIEEHRDRMAAIYESGCRLEFDDVPHDTFRNNLLFLDSCMPEFVALCLIEDSMSGLSSVKDAVDAVAKVNPFRFRGNASVYYEHKMKQLLLSSALGMTPAKEWTGHYDANGGYLVVKKDGEIVCYHFYNQNDVEDYLYNNTRFERASRSRYNFGSIYKEGDEYFIKLNLQIRFTK